MRHRRSQIAAIVAGLALIVSSACGSPPNAPDPPDVPDGPVVEEPPPPKPPTLDVVRILAFGDSLTEGESLGQLLRGLHDHGTPGIPTSYPYKLQTGLNAIYTEQTIKVFNGGKGGERADGSGARDRLIQEITAYQPEVILLLHGVNDLINGIINSQSPIETVARAAGAVEELIEVAHARGVHVILGNLPMERDTAKARAFELVVPYNQALREVALEEGATLVDLYSVITLDMLMPDGLHINETGNQKIADTFYAALKTRYHREPQ